MSDKSLRVSSKKWVIVLCACIDTANLDLMKWFPKICGHVIQHQNIPLRSQGIQLSIQSGYCIVGLSLWYDFIPVRDIGRHWSNINSPYCCSVLGHLLVPKHWFIPVSVPYSPSLCVIGWIQGTALWAYKTETEDMNVERNDNNNYKLCVVVVVLNELTFKF